MKSSSCLSNTQPAAMRRVFRAGCYTRSFLPCPLSNNGSKNGGDSGCEGSACHKELTGHGQCVCAGPTTLGLQGKAEQT